MNRISSGYFSGNLFASKPLSSQPVAIFLFRHNGRDKFIETEGQHTRTLLALIQAGDRGVIKSGADDLVFGFTTWCRDLCKTFGLEISEGPDADDVTRLNLITPVKIAYMEIPPACGAI